MLPNQHYCYRYHTVSPQHNRLPYCYRYRPSPDLRTTRKTSLHYTHCYHTTPTIHCYLHDHHDNFPTSHEYYYMSSLTHKHNQSTHTPTCPYSHIHQSDINIDHNHTSTPVNDSSKTLILATQSSTAALPQRHHLSTSITYLLASPSYRTIPRVRFHYSRFDIFDLGATGSSSDVRSRKTGRRATFLDEEEEEEEEGDDDDEDFVLVCFSDCHFVLEEKIILW